MVSSANPKVVSSTAISEVTKMIKINSLPFSFFASVTILASNALKDS